MVEKVLITGASGLIGQRLTTLLLSKGVACNLLGREGKVNLKDKRVKAFRWNIDTGEIAWEVAQPGPARAKTWSGVMATAGGVVFYGKPNGGFAAVDERSGKGLWEFPTNARMKASPMTFSVDGKQYVVVAAGPNVICFGL